MRRVKVNANAEISIHAPRVGRDVLAISNGLRIKISIHAPRVGRDAGVC